MMKTVAATIKELTSELLQKLGVTPEKLQQMVEQAKQQPGDAPPATPPAAHVATSKPRRPESTCFSILIPTPIYQKSKLDEAIPTSNNLKL